MGTLANSENLDEILHFNAAFHLDLHCLLVRQALFSEKEVHYIYNLESITYDPLKCKMNQPRFIVSNKMEEFISP